MTAEDIITNVATTALIGTQVGDNITTQSNKNILLFALNLGIKQIAQDTLLWLDGETITMVDGQYEYTLSTIPVQIIDVYDDSYISRPRNSATYYGYYQTAPNKIRFNNITPNSNVLLNYYIYPNDYMLSDEVVIDSSLINSLTYFIASKAMEYYKSEQDVSISKVFYNSYLESIAAFKANTDTNNVDTVQNTNMIYKKGLV